MSNANTPNRSLAVENLEDRRLMAASIDLLGSTVEINGTDGNDIAYVRYVGSQLEAVVIPHADYSQRMTSTFNVADVHKVLMRGFSGNDSLYNYTNIDSEIYGGRGDDYLRGGNGNDTIMGLQDEDVIFGYGGNDLLHGDNDYVRHWGEDDRIYGGDGDDTIYGEGGDDLLRGGNGNDRINGDFGDDAIYGEAGNDRLIGADDDDALYGGLGRDTLSGNAGDDYLDGGDDGIVDQLWGGSGRDMFVSNGGFQSRWGFYSWHSDSINDYSAMDDTIIGPALMVQTPTFTLNW